MVLGLNALDLTRLRAQIHALHCVVFLQKLFLPQVLGALNMCCNLEQMLQLSMLDGHTCTKRQACYRCEDQSNLQFNGKHLEEPGQKYQRLIQHWTG